MKRNVIVWIVLLFCVVVGIAIIDAGVTRPINWQKTYNIRDKIPFGTFVLHEELPDIMGPGRQYRDFGDTFYEEIERLDSAENYGAALIEIDSYMGFGEEELDKVLHYVTQGGEVFLSAMYYNPNLLDTLGIQIEAIDYQRFQPTPNRITYTLGEDTTRIKLDKNEEYYIFSKLDPKTCTVLGHLHSRGRALPNFVRIAVGKGYIYLHCLPEIFTNYHILEKDRYRYVTQALNVIRNKEVLFSDLYYTWEQPRTPLRVILAKPGLAQAWYLLLVGLLLLLVFKSKREQRAVKVVRPEANMSKEFAQTIGNMYYENGHPANIIHKKIDYFLFAIRSLYHLDTMELLDEKFIRQLALKTGIETEETRQFMQLLEHYRKTKNHHIDDVKLVNNYIEDYKQKAEII
ncbi:MAG TPA: DUF4350 domain-containing protein [Sphingobacterium sp.]|nr:DUF4350 domain-containing protein [Sphingobacterium sp.]